MTIIKLRYSFLLIMLIFFANKNSAQPNINNMFLTSQITLTSDETKRATNFIKLQAGFKYDASSAGNRLTMQISQYPNYVPSGYSNQPAPCQVSPNFNPIVGETSGNFAVNLQGQATYNIPIFVSPGTADMQPNISLSYASGVGAGIAGEGFNISGLSAITRANKNPYYDGKYEDVNLDFTDTYALNGSRLLSLSGPSGYAGSTYATELENYSTITSISYQGNGPEQFVVKEKTGLILKFGELSDSRLVGIGGDNTVFAWLISSVTDEFGNYMLFHYKQFNGEVVIDNIEYTGNIAANLSPKNKVSFAYMPKAEVNKYYVAGREFNSTQLLKSITCSRTLGNTDNLVKRYTLDYNFDQRTLLQSVTESNADGTELRPTSFCWDNPASNSTTANMQSAIYPANSPLYSQIKKIIPADLNGDGLSDVVSIRTNQIDYIKNNYYNFIGSGGSSVPFVTSWTNGLSLGANLIETSSVFDTDFDNKHEVYFIQSNGTSKQYTISKATETGVSTFATRTTANTFVSGQLPSKFCYDINDYTDDGEKETVIIDPEQISVTGNFGNLTHSFGNTSTIAKPFDFNGDGVLDFIVIKNNTTSLDIEILKLSSAGFTSIYNKTISFAGNVTSNLFRHLGFGDFNGDKKMDLLYMDFDKQNMYIEYSDGTAFLSPVQINSFTSLPSTNNYNISCPDFNGDGFSDIIMSDNNSVPNVTNYQTYFSVGSNLIKGATTSGYFNYNSIEVLKIYGTKNGYKFVNESVSYATSYQFQADFNGDGKIDFISLDPASPNIIISGAIDSENRNIVKIETGLKKQINIHYSNTSTKINNNRNEIYGDAIGSYSGDLVTINPTLFVVDLVNTTSLTGLISNNFKYFYAGALFHTKGKGFLGFESSGSFDAHTLIGSISSIDISSANFLPQTSEQLNGTFYSYTSGGKTTFYIDNLISKTNNTYQNTPLGNKRYFFATSNSSNVNYLSASGSSSIYTYNQNEQGNLSSSFTSYGWPGLAPVKLENNSNTYVQVNGRWRLHEKNSACTQIGNGSYSRTVQYNYDSQGHLISIINDPSLGIQSLQTEFITFNAFGLPTKSKISGDFTARISETMYDTEGRFIIQTKNPLSQTEDLAYDPLYGNLIQKTDIRGLTSKFKYDGIGRLVLTQMPNNTINEVEYTYDNAGTSSANVYKKKVHNEGESEVFTYYDSYGRVIKSLTEDALGNALISTNTFDNYGTLTYNSEPHFVNQQVYLATKYTQESTYFRPKKFETVKFAIPTGGTIGAYSPTGLYTEYKYSNKILPNGTYARAFVETKDNTGKLLRKEFNAAGQNDVVSNGQPSPIFIGSSEITQTATYHFNSNGNPKDVVLSNPQDPTSSITHSFGYNLLGQQILLDDPSSGIVNYTYNSLGELLHQDNPNGSWDYTYDKLGKVETKIGSQSGLTSYYYVNTPNGLNQIEKIIGPNVTTEYTYDNLSRNTKIKETIGSKTFISETSYDKYNRKTEYKYPSGLSVKYDYNSNGALTTIKDNSNNMIWQLDDINGAGQLTKYTYGNGIQTTLTYNYLHQLDLVDHGGIHKQDYDFDPLNGNLISRDFLNLNLIHSSHNFEKFTYDGLDRLNISEQQDPANFYNPIYTNTTVFDALGNMQHKDDAATGDIEYTDPNHPFSITQINNPTSNIPTNPLSIIYNDIKKVKQISEGVTQKEMNFIYGNNNERIKVDYLINGSNQYTRYYQTNYEIEESAGGATKEWNYIYAPSGLVAIYYKTNTNSGQLLYALTDHLGSPVLLTDGSMDIVEKYSYDAWGRRRNPDDWSYAGFTLPQFLNRGFTFHEHIDEFNLINMNGRVYDPILGRFIQPDNYVQSTDVIQDFNRYAYVLNNPLKYDDPTGYYLGYDDAIVAGVGFIVGYVGYGLITKDWGVKAVVAGVCVAAIAEISYVTLGSGSLFAAETAASGEVLASGAVVSNGISFGATFAFSAGSSLYSNQEQIRDASQNDSWGGVGLTVGYGAVAALSTGLGSNAAVKGSLGEGVNGGRVWGSATSSGLNTLLKESYDTDTHSWDLSGQDVATASAEFGTSFASSFISEKAIGAYDESVSDSFKSKKMVNAYAKGMVKAYSQDITSDILSLTWNKNDSWNNPGNRDKLFSNLYTSTPSKGFGYGFSYDKDTQNFLIGILKSFK